MELTSLGQSMNTTVKWMLIVMCTHAPNGESTGFIVSMR